MSVTLFIIKINSIMKMVNDGFEKTLWTILQFDYHICQVQRNHLNKIVKWALTNGFQFSKMKAVGIALTSQ